MKEALSMIIFTTIILNLYACHNEEEIIERRTTRNGEVIEIFKDSILKLNLNLLEAKNEYKTPPINSTDTTYITKRDEYKKAHQWIKIYLTDHYKDLHQGKIYYAQIQTYTTILNPSTDYNIFTPYFDLNHSPHYGLYLEPLVKQNKLIAGYDIIRTNRNIRLYTHLIYIGYDDNLRPVNKYFPCAPEQIIWYTIKRHFNWEL